MMKVLGPGDSRPSAPVKKTRSAGKAFRAGGASAPAAGAASSGAAEVAPTAMMSALIALQSDGGGNAKTLAAAQRILDLLDKLRLQVLEGDANIEDIEALAAAARARAHAAAAPELQGVYDEIALRARVELAKRGR